MPDFFHFIVSPSPTKNIYALLGHITFSATAILIISSLFSCFLLSFLPLSLHYSGRFLYNFMFIIADIAYRLSNNPCLPGKWPLKAL